MAASLPLSPAKLVLLAVHFATTADIDSLSSLTIHHPTILRHELVLRIILTYLPETVSPSIYVPFVQAIASNEPPVQTSPEQQFDTSSVGNLSDEQASRKVKKLHLLPLKRSDVPLTSDADPLTSFLFLRGYRMDEEAGMLAQLPDLLVPFLQHSPEIRTWMVSTVLPLLRRNYQYYPQRPARFSLLEFQNLPDRTAIEYLLAETGTVEDEFGLIGRDLRGLVGPWLFSDARWKRDVFNDTSSDSGAASDLSCPGWEQTLEWLISQASSSWKVVLKAIESWDGPSDIDLGDDTSVWLQENQQQYLDRSYAKAALASAYLIQEAEADALEAAYKICHKIKSLLDEDSGESLQEAVAALAPVPPFDARAFNEAKAATHLRNDLLQASNPLTTPKEESIDLLATLIQSAFLLTRSGVPCTIRRAGDLVFIRDLREQKSELGRLVRTLSARAPKNDDEFWIQARKEILWLHNWGNEPGSVQDGFIQGIFSDCSTEFVETELLKALLSSGRYALARSLYEEAPTQPLSVSDLLITVQSSALGAYDNASNPNRTRGGLKKCDEIIKAFPKRIGKSLPARQRIEALLRATHALSDYRLVLKQGEPFSPVVLRVHSDPVSIIEKVLEQNPKAYTRLQEFVELGNNIVNAGLPACARWSGKQSATSDDQDIARSMVEKRIVAMCIEAALREDDFETAYSYVVSRLGVYHGSEHESRTPGISDEWSWRAALDAGKYVRTERSQKPTHLGTASGNPEVRHLEQRIECLATALRIAPPSQLQEVLKTFRRCEEQLDAAIKEEAAKEDAWDAAGDLSGLPGSFNTPDPDKAYPPRNITASATARQAEEAPMSLFDLSRATARVAQKNLTVLSSLQGSLQSSFSSDKAPPEPETSDSESQDHHRTRKRDQLREAATGTLVSGVGWLIGANPSRSGSGQH
ncbi:transport sec39 [Fusarium albosuccineum]|uniref:Transport sec39 n=1 Tax=Fusarium albosuccineum TaxID=1237068 RepID=A0A8H4LJ49_9HYPO|nr:transport sec39 [Fusarium albosuccineum]